MSPEQVGAEVYGKILKRIQILEDDRVPAEKEKLEDRRKKRRIIRKEYRRLRNEFEMVGCMAQKGLWNLARKNAAGQRCIA